MSDQSSDGPIPADPLNLSSAVMKGAALVFGPNVGGDWTDLFVSVIQAGVEDAEKMVIENVMGAPPAWALTVDAVMSDPPSVVTFDSNTYCFFQVGGALYFIYYDGTALSTAAPVSGVSVACGPGAVVYNSQLYVFYQDSSESQQLMYVTYDGTEWSAPSDLSGQYLLTSPSAVVYGTDLYVFYQGGGEVLYYNKYNGSSWSQGETIPNVPNNGTLNASPAAAIYGSDIYVFYQSGDSGDLYYSTYDGSSWADAVQVSGVDMTSSPGVISYGGDIVVFYESATERGQLWVTVYNGSAWTPPDEIMPVVLSCSPGAVVYGDQLVVFMQGPGQTGQLWFTLWTGNAAGWMALVNDNTSAVMTFSPGAASFTPSGSSTPQLFALYQGPGQGGQLYYSMYNGSTWSQDQLVPTGKSTSTAIMSCTPSAVEFNSQLYVFYQGGGTCGQLWYNASSDGSSWADQLELIPEGLSSGNATLSGSPSAVVYNGQLWVFYQDGYEWQQIWYNASTDGSDWNSNPQYLVPYESGNPMLKTQSPSAVAYNGQLYVFWANDDSQLCYNVFDGTDPSDTGSWSDPQIVPITTSYYADMQQSPSAVVYTPPGATDPLLYVFYQGGTPVTKGEFLSGAGQLWWTSYDGSSWTPNTQVGNYQVAGAPAGAALAEGVNVTESWLMSNMRNSLGL